VSDNLGKETSLTRSYLGVAAVLVPFIVLLVWIRGDTPTPVTDNLALLQPIFLLVLLTVIVLAITAVVRNASIIRGKASMRYYETYGDELPAEWIERPARTYNNLFQVPMLFYVVCLLMMVTEQIDSIQVTLAWLFVATRFAHAFIYIVFNRVPYRFAAFFTGVLTLGVLWGRFASAVA
jgi:hypothetical protein